LIAVTVELDPSSVATSGERTPARVRPRGAFPSCRRLRLAVAPVLLVWLGCDAGSHAKGSGAGPQPVAVTVATAEQRDVPVEIRAVGNVEPFATVSVRSHVEGELAEVHVEEGHEVHPGDLLFVIDPRPLEAELDQAEANLARDQAQADYALVEEKRAVELAGQRIVSKEELDEARSKATALGATVKADRAAVATAKLRLDYCYIRSPITGRLGEILVRRGNLVKENDSVLAVINQIRPVYVQFAVPEGRLPAIRERMSVAPLPVAADPRGQARPVTGELQFVDNTVDPTTGTITLKALFENDDERLWPGAFVSVVLTLETRHDVVTIPAHAVQTGQTGPYVYIVGSEQRAELRPVTIGEASGDSVVVESGITPGELVVTDGQVRLAPGLPVVVKSSAGDEPSAGADRGAHG
jgi:membrane fusion protein, multidrug efflux system